MESIFAGHVNDMRNIIKEAFYRLTKTWALLRDERKIPLPLL